MIEDEILSILWKAKEDHGTIYETASALGGISPSTLHCWMKARKGIRDQPLFKVLDLLGYHLTNSDNTPVSPYQPKEPQGRLETTTQKTSQAESLEDFKAEVLKAKNDGLEKQINGLEKQISFLLSHNETLQRQLDMVNSLLSETLETLKKKESYSNPAPSNITKVS